VPTDCDAELIVARRKTAREMEMDLVVYESSWRILITGDLLFVGKVGGTANDDDARTEWASLRRLAQALSKLVILARGPKPVKVLRELRVPIAVAVSEPNTWREILRELDKQPRGFQLAGSRVAVQEYGVSNVAFLEELRRRGADVLHVPVYRWTLPEDLGPLRRALVEIVEGRARVILFTNAAQVSHVMQVGGGRGPGQPASGRASPIRRLAEVAWLQER
jgi:hypothetical protein